jgi:hypothetical protein
MSSNQLRAISTRAITALTTDHGRAGVQPAAADHHPADQRADAGPAAFAVSTDQIAQLSTRK